jgi:hypothetical protein
MTKPSISRDTNRNGNVLDNSEVSPESGESETESDWSSHPFDFQSVPGKSDRDIESKFRFVTSVNGISER